MPLLGAHMSVAGGLFLAVDRINQVGGAALQIFTRNQRQWRVPSLSAEEVGRFRQACQKSGDMPVAAHDSYLINLASPKKDAADRSVAAFADEIRRAETLSIPYLIMHPGAHLGEGIEPGLRRFVDNLDLALDLAGDCRVMVLIETTAGQGTALGSTFEEISYIIRNSTHTRRLGVCFDTCHVFAAGYDFRTLATYHKTFDRFDRLIGLEKLLFFHLNDSQKDLGSRVDRHAHIGQGRIGLEGFGLLLNDLRFKDHPMVLETPKGVDLQEDRENLTVLRRLIVI
ncbi:MAG: deoxyribonuclease IV [Proteobacteria bacterium]|nr:deoxyribonuclease IV [Pseudomonadota bacterium]MBU1716875.1 deoxyribonuclease IV [Pseudomonadota bacterium]